MLSRQLVSKGRQECTLRVAECESLFRKLNDPLESDCYVHCTQVYCSRACKSREDALRSAEAGALSKLEGISIARDIDLDLLRMMLRLVIMRATALGLRPENTQKVDGMGSGEDQEHKEAGAGGEVRSFCGGHLKKKTDTTKSGEEKGKGKDEQSERWGGLQKGETSRASRVKKLNDDMKESILVSQPPHYE